MKNRTGILLTFAAAVIAAAGFSGVIKHPVSAEAASVGSDISQIQSAGGELPGNQEELDLTVYKNIEDHNPVMVQRFGADPWAMEYGGRIYLYMTGDEPAADDGEIPPNNDYSNITTIRVLSSADLVNWEDHGSIRAAGKDGAAKWAVNSWAPCAAWKTINGKDQFFLYFANSGGGIGVLTSDSPTGPFSDPLFRPLISRSTTFCGNIPWLFDPAVFVDEDGTAFLYFGGGIPEGKASDPGSARVVKLKDDMITLDGFPKTINPPWLFEDSGINKFGDKYVYSYCTNFNVPASGIPEGFKSGEIVYMTSQDPMGPFTYAGRVLPNPGTMFGTGGNNHHCMFAFKGEWYITYHAATLDRALGWNAGYRSVFVDRLQLDGNGLPALTQGTVSGVQQLQPFDPYYQPVSGGTAVTMAGVTTVLADPEDEKTGTGPMAACSTVPGGWIAVSGVDFGDDGASAIRIHVSATAAGSIEVIPDAPDGMPVASAVLSEGGEYAELTVDLREKLTGTHHLFFRFSQDHILLRDWQFLK